MRIALLVLLIAPLVASQAGAASWYLQCDANMPDRRQLEAGQWVCTDVFDIEDDADVIDVSDCENVDIFQFDDPAGDGAETITGTVEMCPRMISNDSACAPLPNTSTLSGDDAIYGAGAIYLRIEAGGVDAAETDGVRWMIKCAQPSYR